MGRIGIGRVILSLLAAVVAVAALACAAHADNPLEKLLMPGPVAAAHAKIEGNCDACHTPFSQATQDKLCLGCHKSVSADINGHQGFHGRSPLLKGVACNLCHDDHIGRDADIIQIDTVTFDHTATDFPLTGPHRDVPCAGCHVKAKRWAEAAGTCFDCHDAGQPHKGNLGKECQTCHRVSVWRDTIAFDHGKTAFPLRGKHAGVTCAACHLGEVYKGQATACNDCHAIQDVHQRRFGSACQSCHNETEWKNARFDHAKETGFPLIGAHTKATCQACHGASVLIKISKLCVDCHSGQDVHKAQLGAQCGACHNDVSWRKDVIFDHGLSKFPLTGLHVTVACESCHASAAFKDAGIACSDCHTRDDVHAGRFTPRCESCHSANGWSRVAFDHRRQTKFALTGKHAKTGCYDCHVRKNVTTASLPTDCYSCHAKQDVHRGKFGKNCGNCHDASAFSPAFISR